jgi:hypothetical protein
MPGFDGTGPMGRGPMTGWRMGYCVPGQAAPAPEGASVQTPVREPVPPMPERGIIYGVGRGGLPRGCGRGRCFGGGRGNRGRFW